MAFTKIIPTKPKITRVAYDTRPSYSTGILLRFQTPAHKQGARFRKIAVLYGQASDIHSSVIMSRMRAMILAAGYGERLWPLTADRTKPALPVLGMPLVGYVAEYLAQFGISEVVVNLHHRPESVKRALGDGGQFGVKLEYVHEPVILGTSGAMDNARHLLSDDTYIVINGKIITDIDLNAALREHKKRDALATLVLLRNEQRERFSTVETHEGLVTRFAGMPTASFDASSGAEPLMFTG